MLANDDDNESSAYEDFEIDFENENYSQLTKIVRNQYIKSLEKQLQQNIICWANGQDECSKHIKYNLLKNLKNYSTNLEKKAIKACMITQFYQQAMLKIVERVKVCTQHCQLDESFLKTIKKKSVVDAEVQTNSDKSNQSTQTKSRINNIKTPNDNINDVSPSLKRKIEIFQEQILSKESPITNKIPTQTTISQRRRRGKSQHNFNISKQINSSSTLTINDESNRNATSTIAVMKRSEIQTLTIDVGDSIARELENLFSDNKSDEFDILYQTGNIDDDQQIADILKQIETAKTPTLNDENFHQDIKQKNSIVLEKVTPSPPLQLNKIVKKTINLSQSLWPCELFMQRRHLSEILSRLIEEDLRWHEIIQSKYIHLFGEDSDDEFSTYSPSIELDETLTNSCILRICPLMVKNLMKPMRQGLIANRYLFKKLAKKLAHNIINQNPYPDENFIKETVENFFCMHKDVTSIEDLDRI